MQMPLHVIWLSEARYKTSLLLCVEWFFEYKSVIIQLKYSISVTLKFGFILQNEDMFTCYKNPLLFLTNILMVKIMDKT